MPGLGFSTETFTAPTFVAVATAPNSPPPLGWAFENPTATLPGESTVSQENAEQTAWQSATAQAQSGWIPPSLEFFEWPDVEPLWVDFDVGLPEVEPIF